MESVEKADVNGKKVLVRVDYNVPIIDGVIADDTRIVKSLETINYLLEKGAKVILMSHLGRIASDEDKEKNSLEIVARHLSTLINNNIIFVPTTRGKELEDSINAMQDSDILLIENTRFEDFPKKLESSCDESLSKYWSTLADVFVLDAFGSAHRCHASTYGISKFIPAYAGFLVIKEVSVLDKTLNQKRTLILGGSKVEDKIGMINNLINTSDYILLGGAMCFTFLKAKGYDIGKSVINEEKIDYAKGLLEKYPDKIILPIDVMTQNGLRGVEGFGPEDIGYDIGPRTISKYKEILIDSKLVLWNGPMGMFEKPEYETGTKTLLEYLYNQSIVTILAGGDIVSASKKYNLDYYYVSTGGGSTLEYLEGKKFKTLERLNGKK